MNYNLIRRSRAAASIFLDVVKNRHPMVAIQKIQHANLIEKALSISNSTDVDVLIANLARGFDTPGYFILAQQGYIRNHVVSNIIADIANKCSMVRMFSEDPQTQKLLQNPALNMKQSAWVDEMIINKLIDGSAYAEMLPMNGFIKFMQIIRPDKIKPRVGSRHGINDQLLGYQINQGVQRFIEFDFFGKSLSPTDIFHTKYYHPTQAHHGLSRLIAVSDAIKQNNEISDIHQKILDNDGASKGFLALDKSSDPDEPDPGDDEMENIRDQVNERLGPGNIGKWAVLPRAFKFIRMAMTGREMDWNKTKQNTSREIAMGLNFPAFLLGFAEGSTFNNMALALRELWTGNIIPEMRRLADDIEANILRHTGREVKIQLDTSEILAIIEILREQRKANRDDLLGAVITQEEARVGGKYPEKPETPGTFLVPNTHTPVSDISENTIDGGE